METVTKTIKIGNTTINLIAPKERDPKVLAEIMQKCYEIEYNAAVRRHNEKNGG